MPAEDQAPASPAHTTPSQARETALREVLSAIRAASGDEGPVFDTILRNARTLCEAPFAALVLGQRGDSAQRMVAGHGSDPDTLAYYTAGKVPMDPDRSFAARAILEGRVIHLPDMCDTDEFRAGAENVVALADIQGIRTNLFVPLVTAQGGIGCLILFRKEVRPFDEGQIALVESFAEQAVIAIEKVRQYREVQTRLEREAATREVLEVISTSREDEAPVFDAILQRAGALCRADYAGLSLLDAAGTHLVYTAHHGPALRHSEPGRQQWALDGGSSFADAIRLRRPVRIDDLAETDLYRAGDPQRVAHVEGDGIRAFMAVPLIRNGVAIGAFGLARFTPAPFGPEDEALLAAFAAQAVIAIENTRQFRELQDRLAREAATTEILDVISRSREDDTPVFEAIVQNAQVLCGARMSALILATPHDTLQRLAAQRGITAETVEMFETGRMPVHRDTSYAARAIVDGRLIHLPDMKDSDLYRARSPVVRAMVDKIGVRSVIFVPLMNGDTAIGAITVFRYDVHPFEDRLVELLETFAAQAVIAIENVRQFREVQTRLAREKASAEILKVISQSREDETPVFEAILARAEDLCHAEGSGLLLLNQAGTHLIYRASQGTDAGSFPLGTEFDLTAGMGQCIAVRENRIVHIEDLKDTDMYRQGHAGRRNLVDIEGTRTHLHVPLMKDGSAFGTITLGRKVPKAFSPDEIALVETFAAQAVIAIENVRQFREVQDSLTRQTATSDILQVINASQSDLQPVFEAIAARSAQLCRASYCMVLRFRDGTSEFCASHGYAESELDFAEAREPLSLKPDTIAGQVAAGGEVIVIEDTQAASYHDHKLARRMGIGQAMGFPIRTSEGLWGCISIGWPAGHAPSAADIDLVRTFSDQAGIAIKNTALFNETQTRLERERASAEILEVISRSREDEMPVFEAILDNALRLSGSALATFFLVSKDGQTLEEVTKRGHVPPELSAFTRDNPPRLDDEASSFSQAFSQGRSVQIVDAAATERARNGPSQRQMAVEKMGIRTLIQVPLMQPDKPIGILSIYRTEVRAYSPDEIALLETFAAQAVIAIENVRQFRALETLNAELGDRVETQVGELERMGRLKRFLPAQVADAVVSTGDDRLLSSHRALIAALFCDIRGFTAFCETAEPEETIEVLQTYHEELGKLIAAHGAGVDHRAGDGIMVLFNDPLPCDDPAGDALRLAFAMRAAMQELCKRWRKLGHRLGFGVGISLGYATVGMVGSEGRYHYTASGTAVNLAARLCDMAEDGEILLSPRAWIAVEETTSGARVGEVALKGISAPVEVWRAEAARA